MFGHYSLALNGPALLSPVLAVYPGCSKTGLSQDLMCRLSSARMRTEKTNV